MPEYDPKKIESKWQKIWLENKTFQAKDFNGKKLYILIEFPYPSGSGIHLGHTRSYSAMDAYCRMKRMQGFNVLYPIGYDAFGLPTENTAIKEGKKPEEITKRNIAVFRQQMQKMGFSFDWSREINTTDPNYYKWTQWIFLQFYKHGIIDGELIKIEDDNKTTPRLAYQDEIAINWCPSCKIGLANEEVIANKCERCGSETEKRMQKQWMLRITAYADRLIDDLETVDYLEKIKTGQINWIGRSEGSNIRFSVIASGAKSSEGDLVGNSQDEIATSPDSDQSPRNDKADIIEVFTTRADTLFGCTWVVLAPEHELVKKLKDQSSNVKEIEGYIKKSKNKSDLERTELSKEKTGVELKGIKAINPINGEEVAVWIADYVLGHYGTGAVMAVPAHDERDFKFAKKYNIAIPYVIFPVDGSEISQSNAFVDYGILRNSGEFDGLTSKIAQKKISEKLKEDGLGDFAVNYKLRDWVFSRQHYWGEPIPLIHCDKCGVVPIPDNQLPVKLPEVENYQPSNSGQSPLANISDWVNVKCPKCGGQAKRETDTMPNWAGSSWYYLAYTMLGNQNLKIKNQNEGNVFDNSKKGIDFWMPVDVYNGGMEHTTLHLLYSRFWYKFLADLKLVPGIEPYQKRISHGMILGADNQKMSKSRGNVINPDLIVEKFGADTLRIYILFIGPYDAAAVWNSSGISGVSRFLNRFWQISDFIADNEPKNITLAVNQVIQKITDDMENFHFNTIISSMMEFINLLQNEKKITKESLEKVLTLFYPVAPHICAEMFETINHSQDIIDQKWPNYDSKHVQNELIEIPIQINGKIRDKLLVSPGLTENEIKKIALERNKIKEHIKTPPKKIIYVKDKILSIVI